MIANVAPNSSAFEETLNTLKYANRAKNIKTNVVRNVLSVNYHISEYENLISGLRSEIKELKGQLATHHPGDPEPLHHTLKKLQMTAMVRQCVCLTVLF